MLALSILFDKWALLLALISAFVVGFLGGETLFKLNKVKALDWADRLDRTRELLIKRLYKILHQPHGNLRAAMFIFGVNLAIGAFGHHTVGGILIVPSFLILAVIGLLASLTMKKYPERLSLIVVVVPFEIGAYVVAAVGGVGIGLNVFGSGDVWLAIREWATLFITLVVPLQFIAAFFEGVLLHRLFVVQGRPWPRWLFDEHNQQ